MEICCRLNKEFSTDGVTLNVKARPQLFDSSVLWLLSTQAPFTNKTFELSLVRPEVVYSLF